MLEGWQFSEARKLKEAHAEAEAKTIAAALSGKTDPYAFQAAWTSTSSIPGYREQDRQFDFLVRKYEHLKSTQRQQAVARSRKSHTLPISGVRTDAASNILKVADAVHSIMADQEAYEIIVTLRDIAIITGLHPSGVSRALDHLKDTLAWLKVVKGDKAHAITSLIDVTNIEVDAVSVDAEIELPEVDPKFVKRYTEEQVRFRRVRAIWRKAWFETQDKIASIRHKASDVAKDGFAIGLEVARDLKQAGAEVFSKVQVGRNTMEHRQALRDKIPFELIEDIRDRAMRGAA